MNSRRSAVLILCAALLAGCRPDLAAIKRSCAPIGRPAPLSPDVAGITLPPNIAPLRFVLGDSCRACAAEIASVNGPSVVVWGKKNALCVDESRWRRLLSENAGNPLRITVFARDGGGWRRYPVIEDTVAREPIDRYCTYRLLGFQYNFWADLRECQRDLTSFDETVLVNTQSGGLGSVREQRCVNCHMPMNGDPGRFVLQLRGKTYGAETILATGDSVVTLDSRLGHAAWHPGGGFVAFSVYKVQQYFHAAGARMLDVYDNTSGIVVYDVALRKLLPAPMLYRRGVLETWPAWSPDGRYLYFCGAAVPWSDAAKEPPDDFNKTRYNLLRVAFDPVGKTWGGMDTVLSAEKTGLSIALPRISPDGRFCLFCMQDFGPYPYTRPSSDLYLMDLATRGVRKLPVNSEYHESWHCWSTNGRWILFSSKRGSGVFTRLYISRIDSLGNASKPFILPQADPAFDDSFIKCYNVPELAKGPVRFSERELLKAIRARRAVSVPVSPKSAPPSFGTVPGGWSPAGGRE